jgi:hypothetical protein
VIWLQPHNFFGAKLVFVAILNRVPTKGLLGFNGLDWYLHVPHQSQPI